ncbi:MAG: hypothetical protein IJ840_07875 [Bacteroidales bacterium]|nr:hypothetical protein [Bacteroidales bacterium]
MNKKYLYMIAAVIWGIPGVIITVKGIGAYSAMNPSKLWWLLIITLCVLLGFFFMFRRIADKYSARIASLPGKASFWQTFPLRGWILIAFMMCLGMALKFMGVPPEFTASFYSGLGPMLLWSSYRFLVNGRKARTD